MCLNDANQNNNNNNNKQTDNMHTKNTKGRGNHSKKYKNFTQFPSEEMPSKCTVSPNPWVNRPTGKPGETSPSCAVNKCKSYTKNLKKYKIYIKSFSSSNILQKGDVNPTKPTCIFCKVCKDIH